MLIYARNNHILCCLWRTFIFWIWNKILL